MKTFVTTLISLLILFGTIFTSSVSFAEGNSTTSGTPSFELFWPLTAGKTIDDPLYFLKSFKEKLRGMLIFGTAQKAEYAILLGTKRVLEAEKLIHDGKKDVADKTLSLALDQFNLAEKDLDELKANKEPLGQSATTVRPRLDNLVNFLPNLAIDKSKEVLDKVKSLKLKI